MSKIQTFIKEMPQNFLKKPQINKKTNSEKALREKIAQKKLSFIIAWSKLKLKYMKKGRILAIKIRRAKGKKRIKIHTRKKNPIVLKAKRLIRKKLQLQNVKKLNIRESKILIKNNFRKKIALIKTPEILIQQHLQNLEESINLEMQLPLLKRYAIVSKKYKKLRELTKLTINKLKIQQNHKIYLKNREIYLKNKETYLKNKELYFKNQRDKKKNKRF